MNLLTRCQLWSDEWPLFLLIMVDKLNIGDNIRHSVKEAMVDTKGSNYVKPCLAEDLLCSLIPLPQQTTY